MSSIREANVVHHNGKLARCHFDNVLVFCGCLLREINCFSTLDAPCPRFSYHLVVNERKQRKMSQARGDSLLKLTENREKLIHRASEKADFARTVEIGQVYTTSKSDVDGNSSTPSCREYSDPRNCDEKQIRSLGCVFHTELTNKQRLTTRFLEQRYHRSRQPAGDREHRRQVDIRQ